MFRIFFITLLLCLTGCTAVTPLTPKVTYYLLDEVPLTAPQPPTGQAIIQVTAITVPEYLNRSNLVMRKANQEMSFANYHSWADSLPAAMQRVVVQALNQNTTNISYSRYCATANCPRLQIAVDHFYPTESGDVVLAGSYVFASKSGATRPVPFVLTKALESGGYHEAVQQMRELLWALSDHIEKQRQHLKAEHAKGNPGPGLIENTGVVF